MNQLFDFHQNYLEILDEKNSYLDFGDLDHIFKVFQKVFTRVVTVICSLYQQKACHPGSRRKLQPPALWSAVKFRELQPVLTSRHLSYKTHYHVYSSCVRSNMLHAGETWPLTKTNLQRLQGNDRAMVRQIYSIKPEDVATVGSIELLAKLEDFDLTLRERWLHWFEHVERSSGTIRTACDIQIEGRRGQGGSRVQSRPGPILSWR